MDCQSEGLSIYYLSELYEQNSEIHSHYFRYTGFLQ